MADYRQEADNGDNHLYQLGMHKMFYRFRYTTVFVISSTQVGIGSTGSMSTIFRSNPELALSN